MIYIKRFIDRIASLEGRKTKDLVMTLEEARGLRDELDKLLADNYDLLKKQKASDEVIKVEINAGKW